MDISLLSDTIAGDGRPNARGVVALQSRSLSSPVSEVVPGERSCDPRSVSAHAPVGTIRGPAWGDQGEADASIPGADRARVASRPSGAVLPVPGALGQGPSCRVL